MTKHAPRYTERYIAAVVRSLPTEMQEEVRAELLASINDEVAGRIEQGESAEAAEHAVLTGLGDPDVLAAGYADRRLQLIGPRYYLAWLRLLKLLLIVSLPFVAIGSLIAHALTGAEPADIFGAVIGITLSAGVHVVFWTTLLFVILERTGSDPQMGWSLESLPEPRDERASGELIGSLVTIGIFAVLILWDRLVGFPGTQFIDGGDGLSPMLNPALWPWGAAVLFALLILSALVAFGVYVKGRWTWPLAVGNAAVTLAVAVPAIALHVNRQLMNPAIFEHIDTNATQLIINTVVGGAVIAGIAVWAIADPLKKAFRGRA